MTRACILRIEVIHAGYFLTAVCLLCAIVALALGFAYTVSAILGIAFLTIGAAMGVNPSLICGVQRKLAV